MHRLVPIFAIVLSVVAASCSDTSSDEQPGEEIPVAGGGVVGTGGTVSSRAVALPPKSLLATSATATSITVGWQDVATNELIYEIEFCRGPGCSDFVPAPSSPVAANAVAATIDGLEPATLYDVRVRATNRNGTSSWVVLS